MRVLSLFSGGGLGDYGLELAGMEIVGQVEIDEYCQKILELRWPEVPKWRDVKSVHAKEACPMAHSVALGVERRKTEPKKSGERKTIRGVIGSSEVIRKGCPDCITAKRIDLISGGFPCQDISQAGRGAGIKGERSGLWKEMLRIICEVRPRYVLVENVAALLGRGLGTVLGELAESGYDTEWDCIPASAVGAPHRRDRVWIVARRADPPQRELANPNDSRCLHRQAQEQPAKGRLDALGKSGASRKNVADSFCNTKRPTQRPKNKQERTGNQPQYRRIMGNDFRNSSQALGRFWESEPAVGRVAHGIANRLDRLKLLGNGQVVQVVQWIGERIMDYDKHNPR